MNPLFWLAESLPAAAVACGLRSGAQSNHGGGAAIITRLFTRPVSRAGYPPPEQSRFPMQAELESERLVLRRFVRADAENLFRLESDPEVMRFLTGGVPTPRQVIERDVLPRMLSDHDHYPELGYWAAIDRAWLGFHAAGCGPGASLRRTSRGRFRLHGNIAAAAAHPAGSERRRIAGSIMVAASKGG